MTDRAAPSPRTLSVLMPYPDALPVVTGITVEMQRAATILPEFGVQATLVTRRGYQAGVAPRALVDGVTYYRWRAPLAAVLREFLHPRSEFFPDRYQRLEAAAVERLAVRLQPDLLHVREPWGAYTGIEVRREIGIPFVLSLHTFSPLYHPHVVRGRAVHSEAGARWTAWLVAQQKLVPLVIAVSQDVAERYVAEGLEASRLRVIPHGVPTAFFEARADGRLRARIGADPADRVVLVVGRLEPAKGQRDAVAAFARLRKGFPHLRLVLAGGGAGYERAEAVDLREIADRLGVADAVSIVYLPPDEMPEAMASADVVVVASGVYEGFSLPAAEGAAAGRAVVATRVGALPEVIEDGVTGRLVTPRDPDALASGIEELLTDDGLRASMEAAARVRATERFSMRRAMAAYAEAYREVAAT